MIKVCLFIHEMHFFRFVDNFDAKASILFVVLSGGKALAGFASPAKRSDAKRPNGTKVSSEKQNAQVGQMDRGGDRGRT